MATEISSMVRFLQQENARLRDENRLLQDEVTGLRRYIGALQRLQETVQCFTPEQEVLVLLDETLYCALALLNASDGSVQLVDEETGELVFVLVHGSIRQEALGFRYARNLGISGWVTEHGESIIVDNARADPRFYPEVDERFGFVSVSLLAAPLAARGKVLGVIEVLNKATGELFTDDDESLLCVLATLSASALDYACTPAGSESVPD